MTRKHYSVLAVTLVLAALLLSPHANADSWSQINQPLDRPEAWVQLVLGSPFSLGEVTEIPDGKGGTFLEMGFGSYPSIDGSTVAVPMAMEFARQHLGLSETDLPGFVAFSTTHHAYENLIGQKPNGSATLVTRAAVMDDTRPVDLLIATAPSEDELAMAAAAGVELIIKPVCYDAFVFITHADNPVESLTAEQIRDIYTGKITNWKEVGGEDLEIAPAQRDRNSGSQTAMEQLVMQGTPMSTVGINFYFLNEMSALVDHIGGYNNSTAGIGYTYQYYLDALYRNQSIKTIAIDGVQPSEENLRSGLYPFTTHYYGVIRAGEEEGPGGQFLDWMLSDEGQLCIQQAGYIPEKEIVEAAAGGLLYTLGSDGYATITGVAPGARAVTVLPTYMGRLTNADPEADFTGIETLIFADGVLSPEPYRVLLRAETLRRIELPGGIKLYNSDRGSLSQWLYAAPRVETIRLSATSTLDDMETIQWQTWTYYEYAQYELMEACYDRDIIYDPLSNRALTHIEIDPANADLYDIDGVVFDRATDALLWCPPARVGSYVIPEGTTSIANSAFYFCDMLETVSIPRSVTKIGGKAFQFCASLRIIQLPPTLQAIRKYAFGNCISLESIVIPDGVVIGPDAFYLCIGLRSVYFLGENAKVDESAFELVHPELVLYAPVGTEAWRAAAANHLAWAEIGGVPQRLPDPNNLYEHPAIVHHQEETQTLALYETPDTAAEPLTQLAVGTTVNVLSSQDGWAYVWLPEMKGYMPLESLLLQSEADEVERVLSVETIGENTKLYIAPSLEADFTATTKYRESYSVIQRFGTWYVLRGKSGETLYVPTSSAQPETINLAKKSLGVIHASSQANRTMLYRDADVKSEVLAILYNGMQIERLDYTGSFWYVRAGNLEGYIESGDIVGAWAIWFYYAW